MHIDIYLEHLPAITRALDAHRAAFYFNNALFITSRLAIPSGFRIEELDGGLMLESPNRWRSVLPLTTDRDDYVRAVRQAIQPGILMLRLPRWIEPYVAPHALHPMWPDYIGSTRVLQQMEGKRFKSMRRRLRNVHTSGRTNIITLTPEHAPQAAQIAYDWYRAREHVLGTMYLEAENTWLFRNLGWVFDHIPSSWGIGIEVDGVLQAVNLSCVLSDTIWCCHTERYRPNILNGCNQLAFREACRVVHPDRHPWVNDGSADAPEIPGVDNLASFKARLSETILQPFQMLPT
ncbi:MAG: phosphatidylglycerol lysyltransferase domain-containing protein [Myxococcota bacterium]